MAVNYQNRIVRDGLVLCLDAADRKSYPGTGTTWFDRSGNGNHGTSSNLSNFVINDQKSLYFNLNCDKIDRKLIKIKLNINL